ncbi:MAG: nitroreductase family protein [Dehalococcoidia bacterium]|nr:nitroreductase family protein [Dehalococcoidia bacterium]MDD5493231.1 nitroreductase family protein [Dehalococcoidia bacterium]
MSLPQEWYAAINLRRSRRRYDRSKSIEPAVVEKLHRACSNFRPFSGVRIEFFPEPPADIFAHAFGFYSLIQNAPAFFAFIGDMSDNHVQEKMGYTGEGIILEATALGLDTCWVALSYRPGSANSIVKLSPGEKLIAVSPTGYATDIITFEEKAITGFGAMHKRKPLSTMVSGLEQAQWPTWIGCALEAARLSPSATNRQPWNFHIENDSITVSVKNRGMEFNVSKRLDCGIAMLHLELGAGNQGIQGEWELLEQPAVARFKIK